MASASRITDSPLRSNKQQNSNRKRSLRRWRNLAGLNPPPTHPPTKPPPTRAHRPPRSPRYAWLWLELAHGPSESRRLRSLRLRRNFAHLNPPYNITPPTNRSTKHQPAAEVWVLQTGARSVPTETPRARSLRRWRNFALWHPPHPPHPPHTHHCATKQHLAYSAIDTLSVSCLHCTRLAARRKKVGRPIFQYDLRDAPVRH